MYKHIEKDEKKLTDEDIVKALEYCISDANHCKECIFHGVCIEDGNDIQLLTNALDLINRLKEGRKTFFRIAKQRNEEKRELQKKIDEQQAEIERLTEFEQRYLEESKERCKFEQLYEKIRHDHNIGLGIQRNHWEKKVKQAVKDTAKEIYAQVLEWSPVGEDYHCFITNLENWLKEKYGLEVDGLKLDLENWKKAAYGYKYAEEQAIKEQSLAIKTKLLIDGKTTTELAKEFGVSRTFLAGVISGKRKSKKLKEKLQAYIRRN